MPRITIGALRGGSGKTIVSLGLIRALKNQGLDVAAFKKGPDYIDAGWLSAAGKRPCHNLDPFLMTGGVILDSFLKRGKDADISIIEGNRGVFDGMDEKGSSSTAELAKLLKSPLILVLDCSKSTRSMAAVALGCQKFDPDLMIKGVILNQTAGNRHISVIKKAIETYTDLEVYGSLPRLKKDPLPMRHLGLIPCHEHPEVHDALEKLAQIIKENVDIDALIGIAKIAPVLFKGRTHGSPLQSSKGISDARITVSKKPIAKIGVIKDEAFHFYYPENLEAIEKAGGELVFLDATRDQELPYVDALYIGGGFPETQAQRLSSNKAFMFGLKELVEKGLPVYAECGGIMYLGEHIIWNGNKYSMLGVIGWDFIMKKKPVGHGYSILKVTAENLFYKKEAIIQGHEFHYSLPKLINPDTSGVFSTQVKRGFGFDGKRDGICRQNIFGTYTHVHALSDPRWGERIVKAAILYSVKSKKQG